MNYKVSKDYPRLKQLLDSGHWVACWVTYEWCHGNGYMVTDIAQAKHSGKEEYECYSVTCRGTGFDHVLPSSFDFYSEENLYKSWEKMNLQFIDPDYERNTLELEDVSFKTFGGNDMTLKEARAWMLSNPGKKITCQYFHDEWIMFDGSRFVFEDGVQPSSWWWAHAYEFKCEWYEMKEETK